MVTSPLIGFAIAFGLMLVAVLDLPERQAASRWPGVFRRLQVVSAGLHGLQPRLERRPEDDGHHHPGPVLGRASSRPSTCRPGSSSCRPRRCRSGRPSAAGGSCARWATASSSSSRSTASPPRRRRPASCSATAQLGHAGLDDPRHLERHHGRRLRARRAGASAGASPGGILLAWIITIPAAGSSPRWRGSSCIPSASAEPCHPTEVRPMAFRLLPKDVKFFDLFVADGENLAAAAERLHELVDRLRPARRAHRRDPGAREAGRRDRPRDQRAARGCVRHARSTARTSTSWLSASTTSSTASRPSPRRS